MDTATPRGIILTVGMQPAPLIYTLQELQPEAVALLAR